MPSKEQSLPSPAKGNSCFKAGLALFSMFFGAGNLIFPLLIGKDVGVNVGYALLGLGITAVIIPLLGLITMVLFKGDTGQFFGRFGKAPGFLILLLLQLILGPIGVIPRLVTLMHATLKPYMEDFSLSFFSLIVCFVIFLFSFNQRKLIHILGAYFTPLLLLSLGALIFFGLIDGSSFSDQYLSKTSSFYVGLIGGYNTMDLIAAFLFSSLILPYFSEEKNPLESKGKYKTPIMKMFISSVIGALLLYISYVGLCLVSAKHGWSLDSGLESEEILGFIAIKVLGPIGGFVASIAVITACLTTAITLVSIFAEYLKKDICNEKITMKTSLLITLGVTVLFASFGFSGIAAFLTPLLQVVYPCLIVLTLVNLFKYKI